jgi:hypothetical protein
MLLPFYKKKKTSFNLISDSFENNKGMVTLEKLRKFQIFFKKNNSTPWYQKKFLFF